MLLSKDAQFYDWSYCIVFMSFFVRFLVFELLSILYFIVVNGDLGLRHLAGKQRSLALQNVPLTLTCLN